MLYLSSCPAVCAQVWRTINGRVVNAKWCHVTCDYSQSQSFSLSSVNGLIASHAGFEDNVCDQPKRGGSRVANAITIKCEDVTGPITGGTRLRSHGSCDVTSRSTDDAGHAWRGRICWRRPPRRSPDVGRWIVCRADRLWIFAGSIDRKEEWKETRLRTGTKIEIIYGVWQRVAWVEYVKTGRLTYCVSGRCGSWNRFRSCSQNECATEADWGINEMLCG